MTPPQYNGPERRSGERMEPQRQHQFTDAEIEMWSRQPPEDVIRLIFLAMNKVVGTIDEQHSTLIAHVRENDEMMAEIEDLGGIEGMRERAKAVNAMIQRNQEQAMLFSDLRMKLTTGGVITALKIAWLVLLVLLVFWWNGHTPDPMHISIPSAVGKVGAR